jgi:hypothetical protein
VTQTSFEFRVFQDLFGLFNLTPLEAPKIDCIQPKDSAGIQYSLGAISVSDQKLEVPPKICACPPVSLPDYCHRDLDFTYGKRMDQFPAI